MHGAPSRAASDTVMVFWVFLVAYLYEAMAPAALEARGASTKAA